MRGRHLHYGLDLTTFDTWIRTALGVRSPEHLLPSRLYKYVDADHSADVSGGSLKVGTLQAAFA
jgi:hypothetical protein